MLFMANTNTRDFHKKESLVIHQKTTTMKELQKHFPLRSLLFLIALLLITMAKTMAVPNTPVGKEILLELHEDPEVTETAPNQRLQQNDSVKLTAFKSAEPSVKFIALLTNSILQYFSANDQATTTVPGKPSTISFNDWSWVPYCITQWLVAFLLLLGTHIHKKVAVYRRTRANIDESDFLFSP